MYLIQALNHCNHLIFKLKYIYYWSKKFTSTM